MELKDYYSILELPPSATTDEIKKAYRRMALAWHPDKNGDDPYAAAQFAIVKEAYEVLTDPAKKHLYLQERWYAKSTGKVKPKKALTPVNLLKEMLEVERSVARMDNHRMNKNGLLDQLLAIFNSEVIEMLQHFNDPKTNSEIVSLAIRSAQWLEHPQQQRLFAQLRKIPVEPRETTYLKTTLRKSFSKQRWERIQVWLLLSIVIAICLVIYLVGR